MNNALATIRIGKTLKSATYKKIVPADTVSHTGSWAVDIARFLIDSTGFQYDNDNEKRVKKGIDYNHLNVQQFRLQSTGIHADPSNYKALIAGISFEEQSGLVLKNLSSELTYDSGGAAVKNLVIRTPYSDIRNQTSLKYRSLMDLKKNPGELVTNLEFDRSRIAVRDILIFVPSLEGPLKGNQQASLRLNGKVTGKLKDLRIPYLEIDGVGSTSLAASGQVKGLPDAKKAYYDITVTRLKTSRTDLLRFIPEKSFPENLRMPENISVTGKFTGTVNRFLVGMHLATNKGNADLKGTLDADHKVYNLSVSTHAVDLGYILKQDSLMGKISMQATAKGSGFDPKKMNSVFHAQLSDAEIKNYNYKGLVLDATLKNGNGIFSSSLNDPNLTYQLNGETVFLEKYPSIKLKLQLDTLNALALHLITDSLQTHFLLDADFSSTNPDALQGKLAISDLGITMGTHIIHTDSLSLFAVHTDTAQTIQLKSEAADIDWTRQIQAYPGASIAKAIHQSLL